MLKSQHSVSGALARSTHNAANEGWLGEGEGEGEGGKVARMWAVGVAMWYWILRRRGRECGRWGRRWGASVVTGVGWV